MWLVVSGRDTLTQYVTKNSTRSFRKEDDGTIIFSNSCVFLFFFYPAVWPQQGSSKQQIKELLSSNMIKITIKTNF